MVTNIYISTECVADLPKQYLTGHDLGVIYFDIETDSGLFRDTSEINSQNVMEYMLGGEKKAHSVCPSANDFKKHFAKILEEYDEIIHICISDRSSEAYKNSNLAKAKMGADGSKIHIVDSYSLSGGQSLVILEAMRLRDEGLKCKEIVQSLEKYVPRVSTSFLAYSADYLYYNGKVSKKIMQICRLFNLHPVLSMVDGKLTVSHIYIGNYDKAAKKYIKRVLGNINKVDTRNAFYVYSGCNLATQELIRENVKKRITFENIYEQQASATVSSNCGPSTFGILFVRKEQQ